MSVDLESGFAADANHCVGPHGRASDTENRVTLR
jgi:hypothetical protein